MRKAKCGEPRAHHGAGLAPPSSRSAAAPGDNTIMSATAKHAVDVRLRAALPDRELYATRSCAALCADRTAHVLFVEATAARERVSAARSLYRNTFRELFRLFSTIESVHVDISICISRWPI
jgi:hypothetical protein